MPLTEEQKRRMEENRRKALEKRKNAGSVSVAPSGRSASSMSGSAPSMSGQPAKSFYGIKSNENKPEDSFSNRPKVYGKCILTSPDRFLVTIGYQSEVIQVFKQCQTGQYNAKDRLWTFKVEEHDSLINKLRPLKKSLNVHIEALPKWILDTVQSYHNSLVPVKDLDLRRIESSVLDVLMPFQREGVVYALRRSGRILLADDMGLGKTLQALAIASYYRSQWPLLVVCPSSVRFAWRSAIVRWLPSVPEEDITVVTSGKDALKGQVVIISYDLLSRKQEELTKEFICNIAILDESHLIKGSKTARTKAAECVLKTYRHILLLSGTPGNNHTC